MPTLHVYNLNLKLPVKHLKSELYNLISRFTKKFRIKMNCKRPGEAWIEIENNSECQSIQKALKNFYFFDRPLLIEASNKEMLKRRSKTIIIKDLEPQTVSTLKNCYKEYTFRYIEPKKVLFIEGADLDKLIKNLKSDKVLEGLSIEFGK